MDVTNIVHYEREFALELIHPASAGSAKPVPIGITLLVKHIDCEAAREVSAKRQAASVLIDADDPPDEAAMYAACISGWEGAIEMGDGKPLPFSPENAVKLLSHPSCKWIFAQVRNAVLRIGNFTEA